MKIGSVRTEQVGTSGKPKVIRLATPGGGSGNSGDSGGDDHSDRNNFKDKTLEVPEEMPDKSKVITWFLLLIVLMTFGGLIGAYIVVSTNSALEWRPFDLPISVYISSFLILISSFTYHFGQTKLRRNEQVASVKWFLATAAIGGMFIASQLIVWLTLVNAGAYMYGNPFAGFFYILTATHAAHVFGGIVALSWLLLRSWHPTRRDDELLYRKNVSRSVGWYWHFMGVLWVVLLLLLGVWK